MNKETPRRKCAEEEKRQKTGIAIERSSHIELKRALFNTHTHIYICINMAVVRPVTEGKIINQNER